MSLHIIQGGRLLLSVVAYTHRFCSEVSRLSPPDQHYLACSSPILLLNLCTKPLFVRLICWFQRSCHCFAELFLTMFRSKYPSINISFAFCRGSLAGLKMLKFESINYLYWFELIFYCLQTKNQLVVIDYVFAALNSYINQMALRVTLFT